MEISNNFEDIKREMAFRGYYLKDDYERIKMEKISPLTKQYKLNDGQEYWFKLDDGEYASLQYGYKPLQPFLDFGFKELLPNVLTNHEIERVDVIREDRDHNLMIRIYNNNGDCILIRSDTSLIDLIKK